MVSRCAAPSCVAEFKYLPEGRLFQFKRCINRADPLNQSSRKTRMFFWLCPEGASRLMLVRRGEDEVLTIPLARLATDISPKSTVLTGAAT